MQRAGYHTMFLIAFILILIIIAVSVYQRYYGSKSIYTVMSLPVSKAGIYCSFLIPGLIAILMLSFTQVISVYLSYEMTLEKYAIIEVMSSADGIIQRTKYDYMDNAVFLSFIRYNYLRIFLPLSWLDAVRSICLLTSPVITVLYFAFCERGRKYGGMALILLQGILLWQIVNGINNTNITVVEGAIPIFFSLLLSILCAFLTYRLIRNRKIA
jgi:hypothetical protein